MGGAEWLGLSYQLPFGVLAVVLWALAWKGWALWLAARRREPVWFIILLVVNTFGILEIIYIFFIAKRSDQPTQGYSGLVPHEHDTT